MYVLAVAHATATALPSGMAENRPCGPYRALSRDGELGIVFKHFNAPMTVLE